MEMSFTLGLLLIVATALVGGLVAKSLKLQPIIGYILAGVVAGSVLPLKNLGIEKFAELGAILLLFSIGLELSIDQFKSFFKKILIASVLQLSLITILLYLIFKLFGLDSVSSLVLALGFSLSSTAIVVKMLSDRGEAETIHGKLMIGWLLIQDLAVVPIMIILPLLAGSNDNIFFPSLIAISKALLIIISAVLLGKNVIPFLIHKVAGINSRELLLLTSVCLAVGTAVLASLLGISPTLGAFIAGFVISESQENHAVFAETRPLRNLFVALFFVTLGFFVTPEVIFSNFGIIIMLSLLVILIKFVVILFISLLVKFNGKTSVIISLGLSQVGEFAFIIFSTAGLLKIIPQNTASIGIAVGLITLIITPFSYKAAIPVWRLLKSKFRIFSSLEKNNFDKLELSNHIIILGFGRVGGWVGKALMDHGIDFVVVDYNQKIVNDCLLRGIKAIYGDPSEKEVLDNANISLAKAVVIAIPDRFSQESAIAYVQTIAPKTRIISRVHLDEDWDKLKLLRVDKLIQPEFEAAISIIKNILITSGKNKEEVSKSIKSIRLSHAKI